jgi:hypothetical protein
LGACENQTLSVNQPITEVKQESQKKIEQGDLYQIKNDSAYTVFDLAID